MQRAWREAVKKIADYTTPFLSGSELEGMWSTVTQTPCYRESSDSHRQWADLLAAVARREAGAIVRSGTLLLEQAGSMELAEAEYIVTSLAAAHLQLGDVERARTLLASIPLAISHVVYRLPLQQMRALAEHDFEASKPDIE